MNTGGLVVLAIALCPTLGCAASLGGGYARGTGSAPGYHDGFARANVRAYLPQEYRTFASLELGGQSGYRSDQRSDQWRLAGGAGHSTIFKEGRSAFGLESSVHAGVAVGEQFNSRSTSSFLLNARVGMPIRLYPCNRPPWKSDEAGRLEFSLVPQIGGDWLRPFKDEHMLEVSAALFLRASVGVGIAP